MPMYSRHWNMSLRPERERELSYVCAGRLCSLPTSRRASSPLREKDTRVFMNMHPAKRTLYWPAVVRVCIRFTPVPRTVYKLSSIPIWSLSNLYLVSINLSCVRDAACPSLRQYCSEKRSRINPPILAASWDNETAIIPCLRNTHPK